MCARGSCELFASVNEMHTPGCFFIPSLIISENPRFENSFPESHDLCGAPLFQEWEWTWVCEHFHGHSQSLPIWCINRHWCTGTAVSSTNKYLYGYFRTSIKLVSGNSAGTVTAFYVSTANSTALGEVLTGSPVSVYGALSLLCVEAAWQLISVIEGGYDEIGVTLSEILSLRTNLWVERLSEEGSLRLRTGS